MESNGSLTKFLKTLDLGPKTLDDSRASTAIEYKVQVSVGVKYSSLILKLIIINTWILFYPINYITFHDLQ